MKKQFKLFSSCIPVKGALISIICDIQRREFHYIPNEMYDLLQVEDIEYSMSKLSTEDQQNAREYLEFFIEKEYAFYTDSPESFPSINMEYNVAERISNSIVDVSESSDHDFVKIIQSLEVLGCKFLELRFFSELPINVIIDQYVRHFSGTRLKSVNLFLKYSEQLTPEILFDEILAKYPVVNSIIIHSSPDTRRLSHDTRLQYDKIVYHQSIVDSEKHCGNITKDYFSIDYPTYFESQNYNSCLNKKLSIDSNGLVKNCPSLNQDFGHHKSTNIVEVALGQVFKKLWVINKDKIEVCKDCQFRYICTDCRAYIDEPNNVFSKPLKCGYDPYENKWKDWSKLPHKQDAISKYGLTPESSK